MKKIILTLSICVFYFTSNAQVIQEVGSNLTSLKIAPTSSNGNSELTLTENPNITRGFKLQYNGTQEILQIAGFLSGYTYPHLTIERTSGNATFYGTQLNFTGTTFNNYGSLRMKGSSHIIFEGGTGHGVISFSNNGVGNLYFRSCNTSGCQDGTYNDLMIIKPNGEVGIGTTNPDGYKLAVNGKVRAKSLDIESGWADFVFADNYYLMPLEDLESYITENGHLPEVPTAADVEENGVNVGETQVLLLQKIEELSLYIIELQKRLALLENSSN